MQADKTMSKSERVIAASKARQGRLRGRKADVDQRMKDNNDWLSRVEAEMRLTTNGDGQVAEVRYRWCDKWLFTTNARDWFICTLEWTTAALLYGSLQGLCNVAGVLKAHAVTKRDACAITVKQTNDRYCYITSSVFTKLNRRIWRWPTKQNKLTYSISDLICLITSHI